MDAGTDQSGRATTREQLLLLCGKSVEIRFINSDRKVRGVVQEVHDGEPPAVTIVDEGFLTYVSLGPRAIVVPI